MLVCVWTKVLTGLTYQNKCHGKKDWDIKVVQGMFGRILQGNYAAPDVYRSADRQKEREVLPLSQWQGKNIDSVLREEGQEECMMERETVVTSERVMTTCAAHTWFMPRISPPEHCHDMLNTQTHTPVKWWLHSQETFVCLCLGSILIFHVPPSLKLQATAGLRYEQYEPVVIENSF